MQDKHQPIRLHLLWAVSGIMDLATWMTIGLTEPVPLTARDPSPGFGWSWDFDYERSLQEPHLTLVSPINRPPAPIPGLLILPIDEPVAYAGYQFIYRGLSQSGRFRLDLLIPDLEAGYGYPHHFDVSDARKGFSLGGQRFALTAVGPSVLRL